MSVASRCHRCNHNSVEDCYPNAWRRPVIGEPLLIVQLRARALTELDIAGRIVAPRPSPPTGYTPREPQATAISHVLGPHRRQRRLIRIPDVMSVAKEAPYGGARVRR